MKTEQTINWLIPCYSCWWW